MTSYVNDPVYDLFFDDLVKGLTDVASVKVVITYSLEV